MTDTTFDEIRRCPRCNELGNPSGTNPGPKRTTYFLFVCANPLCRWYQGAPWIRQRYPDGTWVPEQQHDKFFQQMPDKTEEVRAMVDRDLRRQMGG